MIKIINKYIIIVAFILSSPLFTNLYSSNSIIIDTTFKQKLITTSLETLEEKGNSIDINKVTQKKYSSKFKKNFSPIINIAFSENALWFKFSIRNISAENKKLVFEFNNPNLNSVDFYQKNAENEFHVLKAGSKFPFKDRKFQHRKILFETDIVKGTSKTYFFRIKSQNSMGFYCTVSEINHFWHREAISKLIHGILLGVLIIVILFNITVFLMSGNISYLFFALFSISFTMLLINESGYTFQFIWPDIPQLNKWSNQIFGILSIIFFFLFSEKFLNLKKIMPRSNKIISYFLISSLFVFIILAIINMQYMYLAVQIVGRIFPILFIVLSVIVLRMGYKPARVYLFSFLFIIVAGVIYFLSIVRLIPFHFSIVYFFYVAMIITVTTMGFSLLDKYIMINKELVLDRNILKERNELIDNELQLAENIQHRLIPESSPLDNIHAIYYPIDKIGGDFYDFISFRDNDKVGIFISDVSGHGVPAAFVTMLIKSMVLQAGELREDPAKLLWFLNNSLFHLTAENFATCFYGIYDKKTNHLLYSNAGHPSPLIIKEDSIEELKGDIEVPLAMWSEEEIIEMGKVYKNDETYLEKDTKLLLFTDGLPDTRIIDNKKKFYKDEKMMDTCMDHYKLHAKDFLYALMQDLISFRKGYVFDDDICIICVDL